ncbi:DNA pilot protein [Dipodfec virus RodF1_38]|uniref:DNA pilot protein n=1 Tax=Dipodfec virus RodF1_38 TaxID=2929296 RepID=A0A976N3E0_9VIRU|nr:DNA pilot protein [Dipodfec virus RodF1_38]
MPSPAIAASGLASSFGGQIASQAIGQASGGLIGQLFGGWNARRQWKYQRKQMELQQQYQLEQMQKQFEYQQQMFDYENSYNEPSKVMDRYRSAGINPAAVLGQSGASMSATMSPSSPPSGGPVSGGVPVSPAPGQSLGNAALEASQVRLNNASAAELGTRSDLNTEKATTEESVRNVLSASVDEKTMNAYFTQQKAIYQSMSNTRFGELTDAQISEMIAHANNLMASANLSNEQVNLVKEQCAETIMRANLEQQLSDTSSSLSKLYQSQTGFVSLQIQDLRNNIDSLKASNSFKVMRMVKNSKGGYEMVPHTITCDAYQARALTIQLGAELGANEAARSFIVSDWENSNQIRGTVQGYTSAGASLINAVSNAVSAAKPTPHAQRVERYDRDGSFIGGYTSQKLY